MKKSALLANVPGLTGPKLDYLAQSRYVKFNPVQDGDITRRDYLESEIPYLNFFVSLLNKGVSPLKAYKQARRKFPE